MRCRAHDVRHTRSDGYGMRHDVAWQPGVPDAAASFYSLRRRNTVATYQIMASSYLVGS